MKTLNCICCGKIIEQEFKQHEEKLDESNTEKINLDCGTGVVIRCGYGSGLDGDVYLTAICDDCLWAAHKGGRAFYARNFLFPDLEKENHGNVTTGN